MPRLASRNTTRSSDPSASTVTSMQSGPTATHPRPRKETGFEEEAVQCWNQHGRCLGLRNFKQVLEGDHRVPDLDQAHASADAQAQP